MELTEQEKKELMAEMVKKAKAEFALEAKGDIEKINKLIKEKLGGKEDVELRARLDELETKMNRPMRSGMTDIATEKKTVDPLPLVFQDEKGVEYKALRLGDPLYRGKDEDFSVGKILRARLLGDTKGLNDFEQKAISEGTGAAGGFLLSEQVSARVIDLARNLAVCQRAGAATLEMPVPEMRIVKITSDPTAQFIAEHGEITESEWSIEPITLKAMTVGVLCRASLEILEDAQNSGTALQNAMAAAIALAMDRVGLLGNGATEPRGIDNCEGINKISMGTNGGTLTSYDEFSEACEDIADNNGEPNAVVFSPRTFFTLDRLKEGTTNAPLPPPKSFADLQKFKTNQILNADTQGTATTCSKAYVGDFTQLLFGIRKNIEIEMTRQGGDTFKTCAALIRARMRFDVAVLRESWFTRISGIKV